MRLIGISGKKRCGKDTVADILLNIIPRSCKKSFAYELKLEIAQATGFSVSYIDSHKDNFRLILQGWGTDFRRRIYGEDYWVKRLDETIKQCEIPDEICESFYIKERTYIIPDVRFPNEYDYIKSHNGIMLRVIRHNEVTDLHASECALDNHTFDHIIYNFGTEQQLREQVENLDLTIKKEQQDGTEHIHTSELPSSI
jgi:hypothetical protein